LHHVLFTRDRAEFIDLVDSVDIRDEARATTWLTVLTDVDRCTLNTIIMTTGLVDGASLISDVVLVHVLECRKSLTTMTAIIIH